MNSGHRWHRTGEKMVLAGEHVVLVVVDDQALKKACDRE